MSLLGASPVSGQRLAVGDGDEDYLRVLQLLGRAPTFSSMMIRPLSMERGLGHIDDSVPHPWAGRWGATFHEAGEQALFVHDPRLRAIYYSRLPVDRNQGALTPGRHATVAIDGGVSFRKGPLTASLRPMVAWVQNSDFPLGPVEVAGQPEYAYPFKRLDAPQRFGPDPFWQIDPGQSEVRLDFDKVAASFGTTNLWWGPGIQNAILMSNNAAGFPHASIETPRPLDVGIGRVEAQWIFGRLHSSDWFDESIPDRGRYVTGAALTFSPSFWGLDGLSLGLNRVFYAVVPDGGVGFGEYFLVVQTPVKATFETEDNPTGEDERDQLFSVVARWVLPESGFEFYAEWARNDHQRVLINYFLQLGQTQAFTIGFQKATEVEAGVLVFSGEVTQLENTADSRMTSRPTYYAHGRVPRGYTNEGQVIGAAIGSGSNAQFLGARMYTDWGGWSAHVQRLVYDKDTWYSKSITGARAVDAQLTLGGSATVFRGSWEAEASVDLSNRWNRFYLTEHDVFNVGLSVNLRRRLGLNGLGGGR